MYDGSPRRWNVTTSMVGFRNGHMRKNRTEMVNPRDIAGRRRRRRRGRRRGRRRRARRRRRGRRGRRRRRTTTTTRTRKRRTRRTRRRRGRRRRKGRRRGRRTRRRRRSVTARWCQKEKIIVSLLTCQPVKGKIVTYFLLLTLLWSYYESIMPFNSGECPCSTGPQTPNHILQSCPTFDSLRRQTWPSPVDAHRKLWEPVETLLQTEDLTLLTGLKILHRREFEFEFEFYFEDDGFRPWPNLPTGPFSMHMQY